MKTIEDVERIGLSVDKIMILPKVGRAIDLPRREYRLFVEDVEQVQDETVAWDRRTVLLLESIITCQIDENKKTIFCGKKPEEMGVL